MNSKKILLPIILLFLLSIIFVPALASAQQPLVPQDCNSGQCGICGFFQMLVNIYNFIVLYVATPLAVIALIIGGIMMMISAGSPELMGKGKKILYAAIIGLVLVFCSYLIIDFILHTVLKYQGSWNTISCS